MTCLGCRVHGGQYLWRLRCGSCLNEFAHHAYTYLLEPVIAPTPVYTESRHTFLTPKGNKAEMYYRENTNDWNTIHASMTEDEYGISNLGKLSGMAIDIGAYVGSVGIMLALDNPDLTVLCVEPIAANVDLIIKNIEANGLGSRVSVIQAAVGGPDDKEAVVDWGYVGEPHLEHHSFVGNTTLVYEYGSNPTYQHQETRVECLSLSRLMGGDRLTLLKIDCEGCEWCVLTDPAVDRIDNLVGEWHNMKIRGQRPSPDSLRALLPNHTLTFSGPELGPGGFLAVHK